MNGDWRVLAREAGLPLEGTTVRVPCGHERFHVVNVDDSNPDAFRLWALVVTRGAAPNGATLQAWKMNRFRELVGFKEAEHGRIIGESWVPRAGVTAEEWKLCVLTLARACDRLEYQWTGRDVE